MSEPDSRLSELVSKYGLLGEDGAVDRAGPGTETVQHSQKRPRVHYMDRLRTSLTLLVVVHHCFWVVVAGWLPFYRPWELDTPTIVVSYMFLSGNQAYFMGLFFFLAGLVFGPSLQRKGSWTFLKDRFLRLMVPAIVYDLFLFPLLFYFVEVTWYGPRTGSTASFVEIFRYYFVEFGPTTFAVDHMWFTVTLFAMSAVAVCVILCFPSAAALVFRDHQTMELYPFYRPWFQKSITTVLVSVSVILSVLNIALRILFPDGYLWIPVLANLGFIMQYSVAFVCGILANSYQFLDHLKKEHLGKTCGWSTLFYFAFQMFQVYFYATLREALTFYGHTVFVTVFEQFFAVFWSYSLLVIFKEFLNGEPSKLLIRLMGAAYATYIVHQWIIIPLAVGFAYTDLHPFLVIFLLALVAPVFSWGLALLLKAIPGSGRIL